MDKNVKLKTVHSGGDTGKVTELLPKHGGGGLADELAGEIEHL